jgi:hypothetical protein
MKTLFLFLGLSLGFSLNLIGQKFNCTPQDIENGKEYLKIIKKRQQQQTPFKKNQKIDYFKDAEFYLASFWQDTSFDYVERREYPTFLKFITYKNFETGTYAYAFGDYLILRPLIFWRFGSRYESQNLGQQTSEPQLCFNLIYDFRESNTFTKNRELDPFFRALGYQFFQLRSFLESVNPLLEIRKMERTSDRAKSIADTIPFLSFSEYNYFFTVHDGKTELRALAYALPDKLVVKNVKDNFWLVFSAVPMETIDDAELEREIALNYQYHLDQFTQAKKAQYQKNVVNFEKVEEILNEEKNKREKELQERRDWQKKPIMERFRLAYEASYMTIQYKQDNYTVKGITDVNDNSVFITNEEGALLALVQKKVDENKHDVYSPEGKLIGSIEQESGDEWLLFDSEAENPNQKTVFVKKDKYAYHLYHFRTPLFSMDSGADWGIYDYNSYQSLYNKKKIGRYVCHDPDQMAVVFYVFFFYRNKAKKASSMGLTYESQNAKSKPSKPFDDQIKGMDLPNKVNPASRILRVSNETPVLEAYVETKSENIFFITPKKNVFAIMEKKPSKDGKLHYALYNYEQNEIGSIQQTSATEFKVLADIPGDNTYELFIKPTADPNIYQMLSDGAPVWFFSVKDGIVYKRGGVSEENKLVMIKPVGNKPESFITFAMFGLSFVIRK